MLETVLDYISRTNLFNFIIFVSIIVFIFIKLDIMNKLNDGKNAVAEQVEESKTAKTDSETNLLSIKDKVSNLETEIEKIIQSSADNAKLVGEKIIEDANKTVENIKENSEKIVENQTELIKNDILRRTSNASVEIAKKHIIEELNKNNDLHNKFIDESVEAINGVEL